MNIEFEITGLQNGPLEEQLENSASDFVAPEPSHVSQMSHIVEDHDSNMTALSDGAILDHGQVLKLKKEVLNLRKENAVLKNQLLEYRGRIDRIKKLVA